MGVYIKDMEMPKNCCDCFAEAFGYCRALKYNPSEPNFRAISDSMTRREDCPLIELPPHGRLIDADALKVDDGWLVATREQFNHIQFVYANAIINAPTIIEAEG